MIKALRFCYGTAFVFLRGASKQPQNRTCFKKRTLDGSVLGFQGSFFEKTNPKTANKARNIRKRSGLNPIKKYRLHNFFRKVREF